MKKLSLDTCTLDGLKDVVKFLQSYDIDSKYVNFDVTYSRTIEFVVNGQIYQIVWYNNESTLRIGTHKRASCVAFKHIYFDRCHPFVGGNENLGFSYTKKEVNSMFGQEFNYQDFRIPL